MDGLWIWAESMKDKDFSSMYKSKPFERVKICSLSYPSQKHQSPLFPSHPKLSYFPLLFVVNIGS